MPDRFDVVAVGVAHESAEISGVILRPQSWRVLGAPPACGGRLGPQPDRGVVEGAHRGVIGGLERDVDFPIWAHARAIGDPEIRLAVPALTDRHAAIHLSGETENPQHGVVERLGSRVVGAVDAYVINHAIDPGTTDR